MSSESERIAKASGEPNRVKIGTISQDQVRKIAAIKYRNVAMEAKAGAR